MSDLPDFSKYGYEIIEELGRNATGGRVVYKGRKLAEPKQTVVIKQFQFATGSSWSDFKPKSRLYQVAKTHG